MRSRLPVILLSAALIPGCDLILGDDFLSFDIFDGPGGQPVDLEHQSRTLSPTASAFIETKGVALRDHGDVAFVGMASMICEVSQMRGRVDADYDPDPERPERIIGQTFTHIVAISEDQLHVLPLTGDDWRTRRVPGIIDAEARDDGWVALVEDESGCHLRYQRYGAGSTDAELPSEACDDASLAAPAEPGAPIYIATPWGVYAVTPHGEVLWKGDAPDARADVTPLVAWSRAARVLAVAVPESQRVTLYDEHGTTLHHANVGAAVVDLSVAAADGGFAVLVRHRDHSSEIVIVAADGTIRSALTSPAALDKLWTSPDGLRWAFERRGELHFFEHASAVGSLPSGVQNQGL